MATAKIKTPRRYNSPVRRQRAIETRERIVVAGCALLRSSSIRDWRALTIRGVAEEAGVNERTIYRYFGNERGLRDAVMHRLELEAGIDLEGMELEDVAGVAARILMHVSSYPLRPKPPLDATLGDAHQRQRSALFGSLEDWTAEWSESDRSGAVALLDVLWSVATYERLVTDWQMGREQAIRTVVWGIGLVQDAVRSGRAPSSFPAA